MHGAPLCLLLFAFMSYHKCMILTWHFPWSSLVSQVPMNHGWIFCCSTARHPLLQFFFLLLLLAVVVVAVWVGGSSLPLSQVIIHFSMQLCLTSTCFVPHYPEPDHVLMLINNCKQASVCLLYCMVYITVEKGRCPDQLGLIRIDYEHAKDSINLHLPV